MRVYEYLGMTTLEFYISFALFCLPVVVFICMAIPFMVTMWKYGGPTLPRIPKPYIPPYYKG